MSSSIRRLEAEKASHREELSRLQSQRDSARDEVVALMRESETSKEIRGRVDALEKEKGQMVERYEACLEMLGEREEEVVALRGDVVEMKRIYRDLAQQMGRA